jgi:pimeloyl-ACP methyl ester carboxylesterase
VDVDVPLERLWQVFADVAAWPAWNRSFRWARVAGGELRAGARLVWVFNPIRPWYCYLLPSVARVVECQPGQKVTWEVSLPGFHARHSYLFESLGPDRSRFGSWEVAEGPVYRLLRRFWLAHFRYVCRASTGGARSIRDRVVRLRRYGQRTALPTLLAIPGIDGSPGSIAPIVERAATTRQVVVADYGAEINSTLEGLSDEVARTVKAELEGPLDLLGQSIGTIVAAQLSARPELDVRRVTLIGTFTRLRWTELRIGNAITGVTPRWLYRITAGPLMAWVCGPVGDGGRHPFFAAVRRSDPGGVIRRTGWEIGRDFSPDLLRIVRGGRPALVLMGRGDRFVPDVEAEIGRLRALLADADARLVAIPDAGHVLLPSAAIARAVREIEGFLR